MPKRAPRKPKYTIVDEVLPVPIDAWITYYWVYKNNQPYCRCGSEDTANEIKEALEFLAEPANLAGG